MEEAGERRSRSGGHQQQRRSSRHREVCSGSDSASESVGAELSELRDALRAARRQLDAGERREKALRRAMRDREALSPVRRAASRPGSGDAHDAWRHDGDATRKARQAAGAGLLEQALQESGLLASEAGRQTVAEFLAKAAASSGAASLPGGVLGRPPLPSRPPPPQFSSGAIMPPAAAPAFQPPYAAQPPLPAQPPWPAQGSCSFSAPPSPRAAPHPPPPE